jgi:transcriptional regulator with XRE-family HTH domain
METESGNLGVRLVQVLKFGHPLRVNSLVIKPLDTSSVTIYPAGMDTNPIKELRLKAGMSQGELARKLEVPQSRVSRWEKGVKPHPPAAKRLAQEFNVDVSQIIPVVEGDQPMPVSLRSQLTALLTSVSDEETLDEMHRACVKILVEHFNRKVPSRKLA